jgi:hypothetical protein
MPGGTCIRGYNVKMRHWLVVAALGAAFLVTPAWAQRHGGGSAGFGGHAGFATHGAMGGMRGPAMASRGFGGGGFHGRPFPGSFPGRPFFRRGFRPRFYGYGYPGWGWYGDDAYYPSYDSSYDYAPDNYVQDSQTGQQQQAEIDRLNDEVARLREERSASVPRPRTQWDGSEATELVFRDKHIEKIQNYAIVGQTLWVFTDQQAKKIMLAELDLPATKKANDDRGVDFQIPR